MTLRGFVRLLSFTQTNTTLSLSSLMQMSILQNDTLMNTTSAIPDLSATADTFGDPGFLKHIPVGVEICFTVVLLYMYIHCYIGSPRHIWREWRKWKQLQVPTDSIVLLDDQSSVASRTSIHSIDCSSIVQTTILDIQIEDKQSTQTDSSWARTHT